MNLSELVIDMSKTRQWKGIVWHHSLSSDGVTRNWPSIVKYHTSYRVDYNIVTKEEFERRRASDEPGHFELPWKDVGYHGGIEMVGTEAVYCAGRSLEVIGAHAGVYGVSNKFNEEYIGLCAIGNYDLEQPKKPIWDIAVKTTLYFMNAFKIPLNNVIGHMEVYDKLSVKRQKTCPGALWDMDKFRKDIYEAQSTIKSHGVLLVIKRDGTTNSFKTDDIEKIIFQ